MAAWGTCRWDPASAAPSLRFGRPQAKLRRPRGRRLLRPPSPAAIRNSLHSCSSRVLQCDGRENGWDVLLFTRDVARGCAIPSRLAGGPEVGASERGDDALLEDEAAIEPPLAGRDH